MKITEERIPRRAGYRLHYGFSGKDLMLQGLSMAALRRLLSAGGLNMGKMQRRDNIFAGFVCRLTEKTYFCTVKDLEKWLSESSSG